MVILEAIRTKRTAKVKLFRYTVCCCEWLFSCLFGFGGLFSAEDFVGLFG